MNTFPKANSFDTNLVRSKIMGPNPLKLCEELLCGADLAKGSHVSISDPVPASQA